VRLASGAPVIARRSDDRASLDRAAAAVRALGHAAAVVSDAETGALGYPLACGAVRIEGRRIAFLDAEGRTLAAMSPCRSALLIAACPGAPPSRPLAFDIAREAAARFDARDDRAATERRLARLFTTGLERAVIDLSWDACADRVRIEAGRFRFESLGEPAGLSIAGNMRALVNAILGLVERPVIDLGESAIEPSRAVRLGTRDDDRAVDRPRDSDQEVFERYARFLHLAWRGGLFDADSAADVRAREASTAVRDSSPAPDTSPPQRLATRTAGEFALELPALRAKSVLVDAAADLTRRARRLGPPAVVLTLAIAATASGMAALLVSSVIAGGFALLAAGALALTHSAALFSRKREIENIPTSSVRSSAIGLCELSGKARAIRPMTTPFSLMPCVYYEFRLVAREEGGLTSGSWTLDRLGGRAPGGWRALASVAVREGGGGRTHVVTGSSGDVPFLIEDETGSVEVDPRGAIVHVSSRQTFHRPPFSESIAVPGSIVTVEETYIPEGYRLYVLGELRQIVPNPAHEREEIARRLRDLKADRERMAACDADGDGTVDIAEWDAARSEVERQWNAARAGSDGRSDRLVIGRPESRDLFFISERSEAKTIAAFGRRSVASLALGSALVLAALFLVVRS
jgi:hypothetical protein